MVEPIEHAITVPLPAADAFRVFADLGAWWPRAYTWGGDALVTIAIEPRAGGFCFETGPHGFRLDWGRVFAWEPPRRLVFSWQISFRREPVPDPERASRVTVEFRPAVNEQGTTVAARHEGFERHGADGAAYRAALASAQGWPYLLQQYAAAAV